MVVFCCVGIGFDLLLGWFGCAVMVGFTLDVFSG